MSSNRSKTQPDLDALERLADGLEWRDRTIGGQSSHTVADIRALIAELRASRKVVMAAEEVVDWWGSTYRLLPERGVVERLAIALTDLEPLR